VDGATVENQGRRVAASDFDDSGAGRAAGGETGTGCSNDHPAGREKRSRWDAHSAIEPSTGASWTCTVQPARAMRNHAFAWSAHPGFAQRTATVPPYQLPPAKYICVISSNCYHHEMAAAPTRRRSLDPEEVRLYDHVADGLLDKVTLVRTSLLPPAADGMAIGRYVFLRGDRIERRASTLMAHELVHVRQFSELGPRRFITRYVSEYGRNLWKMRNHRAAYLAISLEEEARREADGWRERRAEPGVHKAEKDAE